MEQWAKLPGSEDYEVSDLGRVRRCGETVPTVWPTVSGRVCVEIDGRNRFLYMLVAKAFVPNPNNFKSLGFKDNDQINCSASNLYWYELPKSQPKDNAEWRPVVGYEGLYEVSDDGHVRNVRTNHILKLSTAGGWGYLGVTLSKKGTQPNKQAHRLVAEAFIPNPENKPCVNHIDGNPHNNHVSNLEWVTYRENSQHAHRSGLVTKGKRPVRCVQTGEVFPSMSAASKFLDVGHDESGRIRISANTGLHVHGYSFEWV